MAKVIMGNIHDYRARQDRFFEEVTRDKGMERGEPNVPSEQKYHTTKREWQNAKLEEDNERLSLKNRMLVRKQGQLGEDMEKLREDYYRHSDLIRHLLAAEGVLEEAKRIIEEREEQEKQEEQAKGVHLSEEQIERTRQIARAAAILNDPSLMKYWGADVMGRD